MHWLNGLLAQLWPHYDAAISEIAMVKVNDLLGGISPPGVRSLRLERFTLGGIPMALGGVALERFATSDTEQLPTLVTDFRWAGDPDIVLNVKTRAFVSLTARLRQLQVYGRFRIQFGPLQNQIPCLGAVRISLLEAPSVDFQLSVAGGEVTALPGVAAAVRHAINTIMQKLMVWPQRIVVPLSDAVDPQSLQPRIEGMLYLKVRAACRLHAASRHDH